LEVGKKNKTNIDALILSSRYTKVRGTTNKTTMNKCTLLVRETPSAKSETVLSREIPVERKDKGRNKRGKFFRIHRGNLEEWSIKDQKKIRRPSLIRRRTEQAKENSTSHKRRNVLTRRARGKAD